MKRRRFVQSAAAAGLMATPLRGLLAAGETLPRTPRDYQGPYYPRGPRNETSDLILGEPRQAVLHLGGRVVDVHGEPLESVVVDIWQTDALGRYKHPRDRSEGERWDDFLYWGESQTDASGAFGFRTYVPGAYAPRPAHIHYKVWDGDSELLTSQIYFAGLGGANGHSRSPSLSHLQTVALQERDAGNLEAALTVVI